MGESLVKKIMTICKDCEDNLHCTNDMCPAFWFNNRTIIREDFKKWSIPNENNKNVAITATKRQMYNVV